ncbi:GTP-binding protein [Desulfosalsimonas propionicica]|uniref:Large ribosomal subunit assembly factor BipA n=1 Tax=Desulfosalsimonas propionicica TaxID=332175 RepID=A0A7W0HKK6_9BACT|nr:translational GTPase TypA [Desulfosalsimonas propionicica]MBA2881166.1 GTP-binding protein [Desulfosalsimonas propionicica]
MSETLTENQIRNIAIIAHVDHGKTTLVDAMFRQSGLFRDGQETDERIMDNMDLERERGITIAAKNCSVMWQGVRINMIDTPGHADFGGEVERALIMADAALLLVDASEGPLPQTRFVLRKTLEAGLSVIVLINKIDRKDARPDAVLNEIYDLFIDLGADDRQLDFPYFYAVGRDGIVKQRLEEDADNLHVLFDTIVSNVPPPACDREKPFQMLVADLGYSDYLGRLAVGRVTNGEVKAGDHLVCVKNSATQVPLKVSRLQVYKGAALCPVDSARAGDIVILSGIEDVAIGDTLCAGDQPAALPRVHVDEPTISMVFMPSDSPFSGREGKYVQSAKIRQRLVKETLLNVAIDLKDTGERDRFVVMGRGEFQLAILIETMRREGFEFCVGRPEVITKYEKGQKLEPVEHLYVDCDEAYLGVVTEKLSARKGKMVDLEHTGSGQVRMAFSVPARALIGYRDTFLTDTRGTGIMNANFAGWEPFRGDFPTRLSGSLVADRPGTAVAYALFHLEPRGELFIRPGDAFYEGMVIGEHSREMDVNVNPCKEKKLTNMRASGKDDALVLAPVKPMTVERAIDFIRADELVEITPKSIRIRKDVLAAHKRRQRLCRSA